MPRRMTSPAPSASASCGGSTNVPSTGPGADGVEAGDRVAGDRVVERGAAHDVRVPVVLVALVQDAVVGPVLGDREHAGPDGGLVEVGVVERRRAEHHAGAVREHERQLGAGTAERQRHGQRVDDLDAGDDRQLGRDGRALDGLGRARCWP